MDTCPFAQHAQTARSLKSALRFPATVKPTSDLHRRSTFQPRLPIDLRLASSIHLRLCLPTQPPSLIDCQILRLAFRSPSNLRWRLIFGPAFQPTFDLRLRPTFRPSLCTDRRLAPPADPRPAFQLTSSLRLRSIFRPTFRLPSSLRLRSTFRFRLRT